MTIRRLFRLGLLVTAALAAMTAPAMAAPIAGVVAAAGAFLGGGGLLAGVAKIGMGIAVNYGLSLLGSALTKKPKGLSGSSQSLQVGAEISRQIIFGRGAVEGQLVYWKGVGKKNRILHLVFALSDWECESLEKVWIDGVEKGLTSVATVGSEHIRYTVNDTGGKAVIAFFRGTMDQTADSDLVAASADATGGGIGAWSSDHRLAGICYAHVTLTYHDADMPSIPSVVFQVKGAKLYDFRKDSTAGGAGAHRWNDPTTWEWTANPAVCDYNFRRGFFRGANRVLGMGVPVTDLLQDLYTAAANICDETVSDGGGNRKRYEVGVVVPDDAEWRVVCDAFRMAMAGDVVERAGMFGVIAGAAYSPVMTLTDDDLSAEHPATFAVKGPRSELYNGVAVSWVNPALKFEKDSLTPVYDSNYEQQDGGERIVKDIDLSMVHNAYQARAIGKIIHEQSRMQATHVGVYPSRFRALEPGDWVTRQFNRDGFTTITMKVVAIRKVQPGWYEISLRQCATANFTGPTGTITLPTTPTVTKPQRGPGAPGTPSITQAVNINADGTSIITLTATWTAATDAVRYVIGIQEAAAAEIETEVGSALRYSWRAQTGITYTVRIKAIDIDGRVGPWSAAVVTPVIGADTTPPAACTGLAATNNLLTSIALTWTNPADADFDLVEIFEHTSASPFSSAVKIAESRTSMFIRDGLPTGTTRYYWIRAKDKSGNVSGRHPSGNGIAGSTIKLNGSEKVQDKTIYARHMVLINTQNLVLDPGFDDEDGWLRQSTWAFDTGAEGTGALNLPKVARSPEGNGTTSQAASNVQMPTSLPANYFKVEGGASYLLELLWWVKAGFTGRVRMTILWYQGDRTTAASTASTTVNGTDYRTTAAAADTPGKISSSVTAPANAAWARISFDVQWSTTQNNAGYAYCGDPTVIKRNAASLVVDGTIVASHLASNAVTAAKIAAGAVTADKISVSSLSAISADMGTLTAGTIQSPNYQTGQAGFRILASSGSAEFQDITVGGGTSTRRPFEARVGLKQDGISSDEGLCGVNLPYGVTGHAWANVVGTAKRVPTGIEYDLECWYGNLSTRERIVGLYPRAKGVAWAPARAIVRRITTSGDEEMSHIMVTATGEIRAVNTARIAAKRSNTLLARFLNDADLDPFFEAQVYDQATVWVWKDTLLKGPRRIAVPAQVLVSGTPTAVTRMRVWMWGAAGQCHNNARGGPGGYVKFDHAVIPGEVLTLLVGGHNGQGYGGAASPDCSLGISAAGQLNAQGGGASMLFRGPMLRANLLGVAGGGGGPGPNRHGTPGGGASAGGNGSSSTEMDRCMGQSPIVTTTNGGMAGGGGYEGGGDTGTQGKGGTNYVIGSATSVTSSGTGEDANKQPTAWTPPGTGESVYSSNASNDLGRADVGVASNTADASGPGMIAIQWLTT